MDDTSSESSLEETIDNSGFSSIERIWKKSQISHSLKPKRKIEYDFSSVLFHSPISYEEESIKYEKKAPPEDAWIIDNFSAMVLGDPKSGMHLSDEPPKLNMNETKYASDEIIYELMRRNEVECIYSGMIGDIIRNKQQNKIEKILTILCHEIIGNKENRKNLSLDMISSKILYLFNEKIPLQMVLPAFPFKDQNIFRTIVPPDHADLGEIALLIRLHVLALALDQVYPFGVEWIIISDGNVYAPMFGIPSEKPNMYIRSLREYRQHLNMNNTIHIIDMKEMIDRFEGFESYNQFILNKLRYLVDHAIIEQQFKVLVRGMKWNLNTRALLNRYGISEIWSAIKTTDHTDDSITPSNKAHQEILEQSKATALRYAAFNLTMKYLNIIECFFPLSLRTTVHPKRGQIGIPKLGEVYPWNGTAVMMDERLSPTSIQSMPLYKILSYNNVYPYTIGHINFPFYFKIESK